MASVCGVTFEEDDLSELSRLCAQEALCLWWLRPIPLLSRARQALLRLQVCGPTCVARLT